MSNAVKVEMVGLKEFKAQLRRMGAAASGDALENAGRAGLLLVQKSAKQKAPKLTRTLSRSIHIETLEKSRYKVELAVGTNVVYAAIQEFGGVIHAKTAKALHWIDKKTKEHRFAKAVTIPPHPYLRPAWDEKHDAMVKEIRAALVKLIETAAK